MYLHHSIPGITSPEPEGFVTYRMRGDARTYARKVYGSEEAESIASFKKYPDGSIFPAWNLVTAYDILWDRWESFIQDLEVTPAVVNELLKTYDFVLSTIPADVLCVQRGLHEFPKQSVWIAPDTVTDVPPGEVIYNGTEDGGWYRQSNLFGWKGTEWGADVGKPPLPGVVKVSKPMATNCDCWTEAPHFVRLGRYGRWDKNVLTHHAWMEAYSFLNQVAIGTNDAL